MDFALAHLSDPHLGPLRVANFSELAGKRAFGFINWHRRRRRFHRTDVLAALTEDLKASRPAHVAVTGDLVNISLAGEFAPARAWLETLGSPRDVTLVPGNHDAYVRATVDHWQLHWDDYMRGDDAQKTRFPFVRRRGPVALIGLSSGVPTGPFLATGELGAEQLASLAGLLSRIGSEGLFRVVLIHHPPVGTRRNYFKRLIDRRAFRHVLAQHGAELVLHGHDHDHSVHWLNGPANPIPVVGVPSASAASGGEHDPAAYNLYRIGGRPDAWSCEAVSRGFRPDQPKVVELTRRMLHGAAVSASGERVQYSSNGRPT
jgi:3',5'-cyclic AMP phosphodiesterase CpdA